MNKVDKFYPPGDDTFTFINFLKSEKEWIGEQKLKTILEIGCGNGLISKYLRETTSAFVISTDINIDALIQTRKIVESPCCIRSSLLSNINQKTIDMIVFNPPYVETEAVEPKQCINIDASFSGGKDGREVIDSFLDQLEHIKLVYLLVIRKNKPEEVIEILNKKGYRARIALERKILGETIYIIKCLYGN